MANVLITGQAGATLPRFAWDNGLDYTQSLTASSEAEGFPVENLTTWRPFEQWKATTLPATVTATWSSAREVSCFALYGHHIGTRDCTITCEYFNGSWNAFGSAVMPAGTEVVYIYGDTVNASQARFTITGTTPPEVGVWFVGKDFIPSAGIQPGWEPPAGAQNPDTREAISRNGLWRGVTVQDVRAESTMTLQPIKEGDYISDWRPFREQCHRLQPFFLHWNTNEDSEGAAYCSASTFSGGAYSRPGDQMLTISARMEIE